MRLEVRREQRAVAVHRSVVASRQVAAGTWLVASRLLGVASPGATAVLDEVLLNERVAAKGVGAKGVAAALHRQVEADIEIPLEALRREAVSLLVG